MTGIIFNIQKFCVNDGPGIRTTVFFKGCPLKCAWCHNPESQKFVPEIMFYRDKCVKCGSCMNECETAAHIVSHENHIFNRSKCVRCFKCVDLNCGALEKSGREESSETIIKEVLKDKVFYDNSGGGITLSGGEPLAQFDFCLDILKKAKECNIHTAIETCGFAENKKIEQIIEYTDLFLFDFKETNSEYHKLFTGVDNEIILKNLETINSAGKDIILRCPLVPGYNARTEHFEGICRTADKYEHILHIEIEPYHALGENKYDSLSREYRSIESPTEEEKQEWLKFISENTTKKVKFA